MAFLDKIAVQLYTVRDMMQTPADIAATLKKIRELGYRAVQVSGIGPIDPAELHRICDANGLTICATHCSIEQLTTGLPALIEQHKVYGCDQTALAWVDQTYRSHDGYIQLAQVMTSVGKTLRSEGITLSYHNHSFEFERYNGVTGLELLYMHSDPSVVQAELDTHWVARGGQSPAMWCQKMAGRLPILHLKDFAVVQDQPVFAEIGEGNLNWLEIFDAAEAAGVEWYAVEQDTCPGCPLESLKISLTNIRKMAQWFGL